MNTSKGVTPEEILENIISEDKQKLLLHDTERNISHNGITYTMVRKDLIVPAMEAYASTKEAVREEDGIKFLTDLKKLIERYNSELPKDTCGCSNHVYNEIQSFLIKNKVHEK